MLKRKRLLDESGIGFIGVLGLIAAVTLGATSLLDLQFLQKKASITSKNKRIFKDLSDLATLVFADPDLCTQSLRLILRYEPSTNIFSPSLSRIKISHPRWANVANPRTIPRSEFLVFNNVAFENFRINSFGFTELEVLETNAAELTQTIRSKIEIRATGDTDLIGSDQQAKDFTLYFKINSQTRLLQECIGMGIPALPNPDPDPGPTRDELICGVHNGEFVDGEDPGCIRKSFGLVSETTDDANTASRGLEPNKAMYYVKGNLRTHGPVQSNGGQLVLDQLSPGFGNGWKMHVDSVGTLRLGPLEAPPITSLTQLPVRNPFQIENINTPVAVNPVLFDRDGLIWGRHSMKFNTDSAGRRPARSVLHANRYGASFWGARLPRECEEGQIIGSAPAIGPGGNPTGVVIRLHCNAEGETNRISFGP